MTPPVGAFASRPRFGRVRFDGHYHMVAQWPDYAALACAGRASDGPAWQDLWTVNADLSAPTDVHHGSESLPPPLVKFFRHPLRWIRIKVELTVDAVVLAHVGVLIVAALYYLITQTNHGVKHWWDTTVTPASLRHNIRDVGEGVLASCMAQAIVWNHFRPSHLKAGAKFRELRRRYKIPVGLSAVVSAVVVGTVAYIIGSAILHLASVHAAAHHAHGSIWDRTATLWNSNWDKKALGFVAALAARRPMHVIFDEVQAYFAGRRAEANKPLKFYHPPVFQARYNYLTENRHEVRRHPILLRPVMGLALVASIGLAGFGYYVLTYKA